MSSCSSTVITLKSCVCKLVLESKYGEFTFGAELNAESKVKTAPLKAVIDFVSTVPSDKITLNVGLSPKAGKVVFESESIVMAVVVAATTRPPLLAPALTGSFTSITDPGLTTIPASIDVVKFMISDSFCSANKIARPKRAA